MDQLQRFREALALYRRHGWRLARSLMTAETLARVGAAEFEGAPAEESAVDAMWFKRAAAGGREAWELRLVADAPYALFELFEPDEPDEEREEVRREMEARLRDYAAPSA
jgi:hypothetical protein